MGVTDLRIAQGRGLASVLSGWLLVLKPGWPQAVLFVVLVIGLCAAIARARRGE